MPRILDVLYPKDSSKKHFTSTRAKAAYALSAALKQWPLANSALLGDSSRGYNALKSGVADPEAAIRRKISFLVGTLTLQSGEKHEGEIPSEVVRLIEENSKAATGPSQTLVEGLEKHGIYGTLIETLAKGDDDVEYEENAIRALSNAASRAGLSAPQKESLKGQWTLAKVQERFDVSEREAKEIVATFA